MARHGSGNPSLNGNHVCTLSCCTCSEYSGRYGLDKQGKDAFQKKDYVSAIAAYDQALLLDEYYTEGWKLRGDAMMELKRYAEAAESYDRAITIDKTNADLLGKKVVPFMSWEIIRKRWISIQGPSL